MSAERGPIALVGPYSPFRGGIARFTDRAAASLEDAGASVVRVTFSRQYPEWLYPGKGQRDPGAESSGGSSRVSSGTAMPWVDGFGPWSWRSAARRIAALHPSGVILPYWTPALAPAIGTMARGLRRRRCRTVGLIHNMLPHEKMPAERALGRWVLGGLDAIVALSSGVADDARALGFKGTVKVSPHPAYDGFGPLPARTESRDRLGLPMSATVLLCFGLVRRYKGVDLLIEALPSVLKKHPDALVLVAGEWFEGVNDVKSRITALGLGERVQIHDRYIPDADVPMYFGAADLLVQPYRKATQSGVLGIAAGYGIPSVVTDVGSLAADLQTVRGGVVVRPEDPDALAGGIDNAIADLDALRDQIRQPSDSGWQPFAQAVLDLLRP